MKTTEFKPVFLYTSELHKSEYTRIYDEQIEYLNEFVKVSEEVLRRKLTNEEKTIIILEGKNYIYSKIKAGFKFKHATDKFNLDSEGIDLKPLDEIESKCSVQRGKFIFELKNGVFVRHPEQMKKFNKLYDIYTDNEKQNKRYEYLLKLEELFYDGMDQGYIDKNNISVIASHIEGLKVEVDKDRNDYRIRIHLSEIKNLNQ